MTAKPKNPPTIELEEITPDFCKVGLEANTNNRKPSGPMVKFVLSLIMRGKWLIDCNPIKFDTAGTLLDGQTRLEAIRQSGRSVWSFVARNVDPKAWAAQDTNRPRHLQDALYRLGYNRAKDLATTVRYFYIFTQANPMAHYRAKYGISDGLDMLSDNLDLEATLSEVRDAASGITRHLPILAGAYHASYELDPQLAEQFWIGVLKGSEIREGSPAYILREALLKDSASRLKKKMGREVLLPIVIKAWRHAQQGKVLKNLRIDNQDHGVTLDTPLEA